MAGIQFYDEITKYIVNAECQEPLHIGNAVGAKEEVLVHPVDHAPFLQASGLAGAFKAYYMQVYGEEADRLFGSMREGETEEKKDTSSRVRFCDGHFSGPISLELRPRVAIDRRTGTNAKNQVKGDAEQAGQKFNVECIGAGACVVFEVYLYDSEKRERFETVFAAIQNGDIQLGGQKSNGCGYLNITTLQRKIFHMEEESDRYKWAEEDMLSDDDYEVMDMAALLQKYKEAIDRKHQRAAYEISVIAHTEGELLVKAISQEDSAGGNFVTVNMKNAKDEYLIPGSAIKGVIRSQMEKIAAYIGEADIIENTFGKAAEENSTGSIGNIYFFDTAVKNEKTLTRHRIRIDKFTGGVMQRGLFSEQNVSGEIKIRVRIDRRNHPERTCGLLLFALRDLAIQSLNLGSGYNVGKGFLEVEEIKVRDCMEDTEAVLQVRKKGENSSASVQDPQKVIQKCLSSLQKREVWNGE